MGGVLVLEATVASFLVVQDQMACPALHERVLI